MLDWRTSLMLNGKRGEQTIRNIGAGTGWVWGICPPINSAPYLFKDRDIWQKVGSKQSLITGRRSYLTCPEQNDIARAFNGLWKFEPMNIWSVRFMCMWTMGEPWATAVNCAGWLSEGLLLHAQNWVPIMHHERGPFPLIHPCLWRHGVPHK